MPITADKERELLNKYHLTSLYPSEWPHQHDDDESDSESDEEAAANGMPTRQQTNASAKSRRSLSNTYRNLDRHASIRSNLSNTQKTASGEDSLVQKDEADPLGMAASVAAKLRSRGLPVEENVKLRNRFMLSSTSFSPQMFLSQVHQDASTEELLQGLDFLSKSIEQKSASLKVLVESNFEKFVRAKATIDNVYTEMRTQGADPLEGQRPTTATRGPHSRQASRGGGHFRNSSNPFSPTNKPLPSDKRKNALTKESEYGVQGIKMPLLELAIKAEEVWGPALGGRDKEEGLKNILTSLDQHREIFSLSASVHEAMRKNDYDTIISDWKKANKYADEARGAAEYAQESNVSLSDGDVYQIILTARMWHDVSAQIETYKRDVWKRLKTSHGRKPAAVADETDKETHMELIGILLQLGVDENPIWHWLNSRSLYLKDRIARSFERIRIEIEIQRRQLANNPNTNSRNLAKYLRSAADVGTVRIMRDASKDIDAPNVIAFWEKVHASITALLSISTGVLGEVIEFWETAQSFIDNKAQRAFPTAVFAAGMEHLELEPDDVANLRSGAQELVSQFRESTFAFFSDPPVDDLSDLYSPIPPTPITPASAGTPTASRNFSFDPSNVPAPSVKKGDTWEKYAFWPPGGNSLSGAHYLGRIMILVGTAASELANLSVIHSMRSGSENLKTLVGAARERCVSAVCAAWVPDAERCKYMELWQRHPDRRDLTTMPGTFIAFEEKVLSGMQKIAYISEAATGNGKGDDVVVPPSAKLLQTIRGGFVTSLYKALSGTVENAEKGSTGEARDDDPDGITIPIGAEARGEGEVVLLDARNEVSKTSFDLSDVVPLTHPQKVRLLITLSNLAHLRSEIIPQLISQFESSFSVKLTDESKTIRDVLSQIDARLFQAYVKPIVDTLQTTITAGITSKAWAPASGRPTDAQPYIYDVLLALVLVHSEVSTTAASLTNQILSYLLEQSSLALIAAFKQRPRYTLPALMQATLDVEFMAQTLNNYTTDRASEVQSHVYLALDERTDNDARARLEGELPEMRAVLKKLREGTKGEFGCFKRERRGRERAVSSRGG
jgi:exocyst complex component 2